MGKQNATTATKTTKTKGAILDNAAATKDATRDLETRLNPNFRDPKVYPPKKIPIASLIRDKGTQQRVKIDPNYVTELKEHLRDNGLESLPPVQVVEDSEGNRYLWDGFQTTMANEALTATEIFAQIRPGTLRDAIQLSTGANASHGKRRTNDDKAKAVERLLTDELWATYSDVVLGRIANVSSMYVGNMRKKLGITSTGVRINAAGQAFDATANAKGGTIQGATRGDGEKPPTEPGEGEGSPATSVAAKRDGYGRVIPEQAVLPLGLIGPRVATEVTNLLSAGKKSLAAIIESLASSQDESLANFVTESKAAVRMITETISKLNDAKPHAVCVFCKGLNPDCSACNGSGWLTRKPTLDAPDKFRDSEDTATPEYWNEVRVAEAKRAEEQAKKDAEKEAKNGAVNAAPKPSGKKAGRRSNAEIAQAKAAAEAGVAAASATFEKHKPATSEPVLPFENNATAEELIEEGTTREPLPFE